MKKMIIPSLLVLAALLLSGCGTAATPTPVPITGIDWQWSAMQETAPASQSAVPPAEMSKYTIVFNTDGTAAIKADCNNVTATYKISGSSLTITLGASTLMACGDNSMDTIYLGALSKVDSYAVASGQLQLMFANNGGKMDFTNGGAAQ